MRNHLSRRVLVAAATLVTPLIMAFSQAAPAHASSTAGLTLSDGNYGTWAASGTSFSPSRSDVQLWVQDVTGQGWSTLEYQSGITTSSFFSHCYRTFCYFNPGGELSAAGALGALSAPFVGSYALHTLACAHQYQAVAYDPADGWIYSNILSEPACPIIY